MAVVEVLLRLFTDDEDEDVDSPVVASAAAVFSPFLDGESPPLLLLLRLLVRGSD